MTQQIWSALRARPLWWALWAAAALAGCKTTTTTTTSLADMQNSPPMAATPDAEQAQRRAQLRLQLATGYFENGQTEVALQEINQSLAADPNSAEAYSLRGLVYMRLDDPAQAEDSFRRAIALKPRDPNTRHNYGWLLCQQKRYADAMQQFAAALAAPGYQNSARTLMTQGVCQVQAGDRAMAEKTLMQAYELDAANPVTGYNLALLLYQREDYQRALFYIRRINNGQAANAESLWLGVKIERRLGNREAMTQLAEQLQRRYPQSREAIAYERGSFND
jgi:type IV pilus assembly protein PilF